MMLIDNQGNEYLQERSAGIVVCRLVSGKREYLVLRYIPGHWDFAKGKLDPGETNEQAAHRELFEETGLYSQVFDGFLHKLSYVYRNPDRRMVSKTVVFYVGFLKGDDAVTLSHEHIEFSWLPFAQACKKLTHLNARKLLEEADAFLESRQESEQKA
ncbi:NUDIX domain-containing protein [bacterium]|nr:NUDIX domain-containing protein [bacterium]MBT3903312.1 NUDIX domain-containing protein [bacterium]MBT4577560.1 NUDIX domain-containing protein [bacterium]MBT6529187.1 NUDIX domain-containing protein [bacterium]